jgi:hypothetical protein
MPKTWKQKMDGRREPSIEALPRAYGGAPAGAKMLVATPRLVEAYMRAIPEGETRSVPQMRDELARAHGADIACPMSTSIFVRIAAEAGLEELAAGAAESAIVPFWRVIEPSSALARKLSCGAEYIQIRRSLEGAASLDVKAG